MAALFLDVLRENPAKGRFMVAYFHRLKADAPTKIVSREPH
jgi:hypothetical protein